MKFSPAQIEDVRARNPVPQLCQHWGFALRAGSHKFGQGGFTGPCPLHSPDPSARDSMGFECSADSWVCAVCNDGGDVFSLAAKRDGFDPQRDFVKVVEILGGVREVDEAAAAAAAAARQAEQLATQDQRNEWRDRERAKAYDLYYKYGIPIMDPRAQPARDYLRTARGLELPPRLLLRFNPAARYYVQDRPKPRLIHTGPAMLGAIRHVVDGRVEFGGVHITWFDLSRPKGKALIVDGKTQQPLPVKKMRGSKAGGWIDLTGADDPRTLVLGEGIEKVLAIATAFEASDRDLSSMAFWSAGDLGNLAGKHLELVKHPTEKTPQGRARRVAGGIPDMTTPSIEIPRSVTRLVLLGDSTSDPFLTQFAMTRAAARYRRQRELLGEDGLPLDVVCAWPPAGGDFDDLLREAT